MRRSSEILSKLKQCFLRLNLFNQQITETLFDSSGDPELFTYFKEIVFDKNKYSSKGETIANEMDNQAIKDFKQFMKQQIQKGLMMKVVSIKEGDPDAEKLPIENKSMAVFSDFPKKDEIQTGKEILKINRKS